MMKVKHIIFSLIIISTFYSGSAQVRYTLKDCIGIGLERNFSILIARNNQTISGNNYTIGNAGYLPAITLGSLYNGTVTNFTQNNDPGGKTTVNGSVTNSANASVNLNWTIFSGFNVSTTYKKLNELRQVGELNTQITVENYISSIVSVYYNYIQQVELVNNLKYAVTLSKERLRIDEQRYLLGSNSKLQVLQSRVYLNADSSLLSQQTEALKATQIRLNELMAVDDMSGQFVLTDTIINVQPDLLFEKLLDETLRLNTSLKIASKNKTISQYDYKLIVSRTYPYLTLSSGYSLGMNNYSTGGIKSDNSNGVNYGLTLGVNLFNGFNNRREIKNASIDIKNMELQYAQVEQGIKADLITIYSAYRNNLRLINLEEQNFETATENLSIAMDRYKLGNLAGIDLRDVQKSFLDARESLLTIRYQAKLAEISLLVISGHVMEYFR